MFDSSLLSSLPNRPALYAMYGGRGGNKYVAYVGVAGELRPRIGQHLIRRDSSVTTQTSAVTLNPDKVTEIEWWENDEFSDRVALEAAELVAFEVLNPALRSRGNIRHDVRELVANQEFVERIKNLLRKEASGKLEIPNLSRIIERLQELEKRVRNIEDSK